MGDATGPEAPRWADETELIQAIFAPLSEQAEGALGLWDDAALFRPVAGVDLVLTSDMSVAGVHFLESGDPADIGYRALAVNVSDLIAKGAEGGGYLLSLALPKPLGRDWLARFADGLRDAQAQYDCVLLGGDTVSTTGPLTISIAATGAVPTGQMVLRSRARAGDRVYVTGTIGDAAAGLNVLQAAEDSRYAKCIDDTEQVASRYWRPDLCPQVIPALREFANAAMDISDGLVGDFAKLCKASGVGGVLRAADVPLSSPVRRLIEAGLLAWETVLTGGDDYQVLVCVSEESADAFEEAAERDRAPIQLIGQIDGQQGVRVLDAQNHELQLASRSFDHFAAG